MCVWGHKRTSRRPLAMSALPPNADIRQRNRHVALCQKRTLACTNHLLVARRGAAETSLRLWSRMAQLMLSTKYVTVEACNPPASARGNIEIIDSGLDVRRDSVPIKLRIFIDDVCWRFIAELLVQTNLFKFVVERIGFSQIVWIAKLTDEICGS